LTFESATFEGKTRIARQQMVYSALGGLMHALTIRALAPSEG